MNAPSNPYASPTSTDRPVNAEPSIAMNPGSLARVAFGLRLVVFGLVAMIVGDTVFVVSAASDIWKNADFRFEIFVLTALLLLVGRLIKLVGVMACLATPEEVRTKWPLRIAVAAAAIALALEILVSLNSVFLRLLIIHEWAPRLGLARYLAASAGALAFIVYNQRLSLYVRRRALIVWSSRLLAFCAVCVAISGFSFWQREPLFGKPKFDLATDTTGIRVELILWLTFELVQAVFIHRLRKAVLAKESRLERLADRG
ncbi:MAG TPA: hypothetical protein VGY55_23820 [Pirellulales bacterium]|jgi:hypothetical protein|nr:hypothetical protein [Pirellulales bacterium]